MCVCVCVLVELILLVLLESFRNFTGGHILIYSRVFLGFHPALCIVTPENIPAVHQGFNSYYVWFVVVQIACRSLFHSPRTDH